MTMIERDRRRAVRATLVSLALSLGGCGGKASAPATTAAPATTVVDVVGVVERPLDGNVSMPGELEAYETVAVYPRATGFVKSVPIDRGSRVRSGQVLALLEAPELLAQRAEVQSKLQAAEAQLAAARSKAD